MKETSTDNQTFDSYRKGTQALTTATMSICKELVTKLNQSFGKTEPNTGAMLFKGWLQAQRSVLETMGYDSDCDPSAFDCQVSINTDRSDAKVRYLSLDYSGTFFRKAALGISESQEPAVSLLSAPPGGLY